MNMQQPTVHAFQAPGTPDPEAVNKGYVIQATPLKKVGCIAMQPESRHVLPVNRCGRIKGEYLTAKDRRNFVNATVTLFCMHPGCVGKRWKNEASLFADHPKHVEMQARAETHLYGAWSDDPCNTVPDKDCLDCLAATEKATSEARAKTKGAPEVPTCCAKHTGGVVGLLTPGDPNVTGDA